MNRRIPAVTIAAVALFGLTACTGAPGPGAQPSTGATAGEGGSGGSQSVADACAVVQTEVEAAVGGFENLDAASDPQTLVQAMTASADALTSAIGRIDNEEVADAAQGLQEGFAGIAESTQAVLVDGDVERADELEALGTAFQESFTQFQELCVPE